MDKQQRLDFLIRNVGVPVAIAATCTLIVYLFRRVFAVPSKNVGTAKLAPRLPGSTLKSLVSSIVPFYTQRFEFMRDGFRSVQSSTFRFKLLNVQYHPLHSRS
jgi:hypothetical protein